MPTLPYPIRIKHSNVDYTTIPSCATRLQAQCNISGILHSTLELKTHLVTQHRRGVQSSRPSASYRMQLLQSLQSQQPQSQSHCSQLRRSRFARRRNTTEELAHRDADKQARHKQTRTSQASLPLPFSFSFPPFSSPSESEVRRDDWTSGHWSPRRWTPVRAQSVEKKLETLETVSETLKTGHRTGNNPSQSRLVTVDCRFTS